VDTPASPEPAGSTRRDFGKVLALLALTPLAAATPAAQAEQQQPPAAKDDKALTPAQALTEVVKNRHGKNLTDEQLQSVQRSITNLLAVADRLKKFPLTNGDEPAFVFSPDAR